MATVALGRVVLEILLLMHVLDGAKCLFCGRNVEHTWSRNFVTRLFLSVLEIPASIPG